MSGERELLAAALWADDVGSDAPAFSATSPANQRCYLRTASALLSVVDRIASERAAAELERMAQSFRDAIDEADAHTSARTQGESESAEPFSRGFAMGLCVGASIAGMPEEVWASPQRHVRQDRAAALRDATGEAT